MTRAERALAETLPLLADLGVDELARILRASTVQSYPSGVLICEEAAPADTLHAVISGTVEIYSTGNGREWGLMLMNSGDIIAPGAVLFDEPHTVSARTLCFCRMLAIDAGEVRAQAARSAQFAMHLGRALAGQFRVAMRQVVDLKSRNAAQRLGSFLLKLADRSTVPTPELPMRKRNLAARIGMTPETLSRTLQILAANGLVVRGRQIIVRDRERIEDFCGPEPYRPPAEDALQVHVL